MSKSIAVLGTACLLAAAGCGGGAQTDKPVTTTTNRGATTSPSGDAADARGTSQVRLVSALPATQRIDLASENGVVFSAVPYKSVTPYKELTDNAARFSIRSAGASSETLADNNEAMADGHRYTLVALPEEKGKGAQLKAFRDEVVPESGKAKVRVINAAPNFGEVDVQLAGQKDMLFEDIDFGHEAGYKEIDPQSGTLQLRRDGGENATAAKVISAGRMQFEAGRAYTLVVAGANPAKPDIIKFVDEPTGGQTSNAANAADDAARPRTGDTSPSGTSETSSSVIPPARDIDTSTTVKTGAMGGESDAAGTPRRKAAKEPS
jgi:hypothetical protein